MLGGACVGAKVDWADVARPLSTSIRIYRTSSVYGGPQATLHLAPSINLVGWVRSWGLSPHTL